MDRPETAQALAAGSESEPGPGGTPGAAASGPGDGSAAASWERLATGSGPNAIDVAIVLPDAGAGTSYQMFEAVGVTPEGATLRGGLLLEVNEEVTLELRLPDESAFRTRARVVEIVHGRPPAMKVVWAEREPESQERMTSSWPRPSTS